MNRINANQKCKQGTILFYGTPAYGHINPTLPVISALIEHGYRIIYYATEEFRESIEASGAEFRAYEFGELEFTPEVGSHIFELTELILCFTMEQLDNLAEQAGKIQPVLILHDTLAFWGRAVAQVLQIKAASVNSIVTVYKYWGKAFRMYSMRFLGSSMKELEAVPNIIKYKKQLAGRYSIKRMHLLGLLMNEEDFNLFTYPKPVHPEGDIFGEDFFFLGPTAILRKDTKDLEEEYHYEHLIYVSLGTIFNKCMDFYESIFHSFAGSKYTVVISCGGLYDKLKEKQIPENIIVKPYVNQLQIFKKAKLFISAGGMNSICEAASFGVPCLMYPQQGEQDINARGFERLGLGKVIRNKKKLFAEAEQLMDNYHPDQEVLEEFVTVRLQECIDKLEAYWKKQRGKEPVNT